MTCGNELPCQEGALGKPTCLGWKIANVQKTSKNNMSEKDGNWQKKGKTNSFKSRKCKKNHQCKNMKLWSRRAQFPFWWKDASKETSSVIKKETFSQGGWISNLGWVIQAGKQNLKARLFIVLNEGTFMD